MCFFYYTKRMTLSLVKVIQQRYITKLFSTFISNVVYKAGRDHMSTYIHCNYVFFVRVCVCGGVSCVFKADNGPASGLFPFMAVSSSPCVTAHLLVFPLLKLCWETHKTSLQLLVWMCPPGGAGLIGLQVLPDATSRDKNHEKTQT